MIKNRSIILIYIGFLWLIQNVLADDLNLKNILFSGFDINNTSKYTCTYTEVAPKEDKAITRVLDGDNVIWDSDGTHICSGVILITRQGYSEVLLYIEFMRYTQYSVKYYHHDDGSFKEIDKDSFDGMLSNLSDGQSSQGSVEEDEPEEGTTEGTTEDSTEDDTADTSEDTNEGSSEEVIINEEEHVETLGDYFAKFEGTDVFLNKKGSLRRVPEYQCDPKDRECCNQKRVLDIMRPEENKRVRYEYEINDGVPTMTITSKKNKRVTMVYENEHNIWSSNGDEKLVLLSAHSFNGEYQLVELFYLKNKKNRNVFFIKDDDDDWDQVDDDKFVQHYKELKSQINHKGDLALNVSNVKNADKFYEKYENNDVFKATTYFPITGYHLTKVGDGDKLIWSSQNRRCVAAIVISQDNAIKFLKLEILSGEDTTFAKFYMKQGKNYIKIDEEDFEKYINNEKPLSPEPSVTEVEDDYQGQQMLEYKDEHKAHHKRKPSHKETNVQTDQQVHDEYEAEDINLEDFKFDKPAEQQEPKITTDKDVGTDVQYDENNPVELDLNNLKSHQVSSGEYKKVKYKSVFPKEGNVFNLLKLGDNLIWEGNPNRYCDFVRVFYHESEPKLGFMRLNDSGKESDRYFIEDSGLWKFVSEDNFKLVFDLYAEYEESKQASQGSAKEMQTEAPVHVQTESKHEKPQQDYGKTHGPYRARQPGSKEETSPMAFFIFDINDEEQALHS